MVKVKEDLTGRIFGLLTVIEQVEDYIQPNGRHVAMWKCKCACKEHNIVRVLGDSLKSGKTTSCGCVHNNIVSTLGKKNKKYNKYDFSYEYGIGFCSNTESKFYFDWEDFNSIKNYCWYEQIDDKGFRCLRAYDNKTNKKVMMKNIIFNCECDNINGDALDNRRQNLRPTYTIINVLNDSVVSIGQSGYIKENNDIYYVTEKGARYKVLPCKAKFDISNIIFGRLTVICRVEPPNHISYTEQSFWLCRCQCGNYCIVARKNLVQQTTKSCGCYHLDICLGKKHNNIFEFYEDFCEVFDYKHEKSFKIDISDVNKIQKYYWSIKQNGYVVAHANNTQISLHRLLMNAPDNKVVDHANRDPSDNRRANLRLCDTIENTRNKSLNCKNTSGVMGVSQDKDGVWYAYIMMYGKNKHLYRGNNKEDAIKTRLIAEKKLYKEFAPQQHLFDQYGIKEIQNDRK